MSAGAASFAAMFEADRPHAEHPHAEHPHADHPHADHPAVERQIAERNEAERQARIAAVYAELAEIEAKNAAVPLKPRRQRRTTGPSVVYSIRLDPEEVAALERRAEDLDTKPTALARIFIRNGLGAEHGEAAAPAIDRLGAALDEVRAAVLAPVARPSRGTRRSVRRRWRP